MSTKGATFNDLVATMGRLRGPGGCPWDREQTHATLRAYLVEETYETLEAIDSGAPDRLRQELGDLLLQVVFHAQMAAEAGTFTIDDVVSGLVDKLIRRHPHVFGDTQVTGSGEVLANWEMIKAEERAEGLHGPAAQDSTEGSAVDGLPRALPALALAQQMQERAGRAGFTRPALNQAVASGQEALTALAAAPGGDPTPVTEVIGDLLFTVAGLPACFGLDGEQALRDACARFRERLRRLEASAQGRPGREFTPDELFALWHATR
jgi:tetrapyrrole methylase family protein/MazG family protein